MKIFKHKTLSEKIEIVGIGFGRDELICRYVHEELSSAFFSITKSELSKYYVEQN